MTDINLSCPVPLADDDTVLLAHGSGGKAMHRLLESVFLPAFSNPALAAAHDGAALTIAGGRLAFTTDSYVVRPLFFPGGDIGTLAVNGTVNDLAMCGARPLYLSTGFILEEGLPLQTLRQVVASMQAAANAAHVSIVTGDTKVVDRGKADGLFINTAGIGVLEHNRTIAPQAIQPGDAVILSGDVGRHGMAIMAAREGLAFEGALQSDCAPVAEEVLRLLAAGVDVHCLRDLTRGGLASALVELASASAHGIHIQEDAIPVMDTVRGACEILGIDPLYVANEGRFVAFVQADSAALALTTLGAAARQIGTVRGGAPARVTLASAIGATRVLDMLTGDPLPRIC